MSCGRALNFDQWKTFSENYKPIMGSLQIYREVLSLATFLRVHSNSKDVSYQRQIYYTEQQTPLMIHSNYVSYMHILPV